MGQWGTIEETCTIPLDSKYSFSVSVCDSNRDFLKKGNHSN